MTTKILEALTLTAEVTNTQVSEGAAAMIYRRLQDFPEASVLYALGRVADECKGRLTLADILERLPDLWPGAEEAWASCPKTEEQTAVVTEEALQAWGVVKEQIEAGDQIGARMAFKEAYSRLCHEAKLKGARVRWVVTLGTDAQGREAALADAVVKGRIPIERAIALAGDRAVTILRLAGLTEHPLLQAPSDHAMTTETLKALVRGRAA